jgi:hypothetical protein
MDAASLDRLCYQNLGRRRVDLRLRHANVVVGRAAWILGYRSW